MRHALAVARSGDLPDADRPLTAEGRRFVAARALPLLRALPVQPGRILHSPWRRAAETADLLKTLCARAPEPLASLAAAPRAKMLKDLRGESVLAVGHQPWLSELALLLVFGDCRFGADRLRIAQGGMAWLHGDLNPAGMRLMALWPPELAP